MHNSRKIFSIAIVITLSFTTFLSISSLSNATQPCTVRGYVYVDKNITTPDQIKLCFPEQNIIATIPGDPMGYFIFDFNEDIGETGDFYVTINEQTYLAEEKITVQYEVYIYKINLTVNTTLDTNNPPYMPSAPDPENNSEDVGLNPQLSIYAKDPDGDTMTVSFYDAEGDELIGTVANVENASRAEVTWNGLSLNTSYYWYAVANDSEFETYSDVFCFKTIEEENIKPHVTFITPEKGGLYLFGKKIFSGILKTPLIIGNITIEINATDPDDGIDRVELKIKGLIRGETITINESPYKYNWDSFGFGKYTITATAYDVSGSFASTSMAAYKFF